MAWTTAAELGGFGMGGMMRPGHTSGCWTRAMSCRASSSGDMDG